MSETDASPTPADRDAGESGKTRSDASPEASEATQGVRPEAAPRAAISPAATRIGGSADGTEDGRRSGPVSAEGAGRHVGAGDSVGPYRLVRKLGEGGMGAVWEAVHVHLDRPVAIKLLPASLLDSPEAVARFFREMKAAGRVTHPNVVQAHDAGQAAGIPYLAMELVAGSDLHRFVQRKGPLSPLQAARAVRQAALGLAAAHAQGLVHRDVKPMNLLLGKDGKVKLLDLGLARLAEDAAEEASRDGLTRAGVAMGTPDYMAPEQWEDAHSAGPAVDLYALGCTLFFLLTGRAPFSGKPNASAVQKMTAHVREPAPDLAAIRSDVPAGLCNLYRRLMAKKPEERPASAAELAEALLPFTIRPSETANASAPDGDAEVAAATVGLAGASVLGVASPTASGLASGSAPTATYLPAVKVSRPSTAPARKSSTRNLPIAWWGAAGFAGLLLICGIVVAIAYATGNGAPVEGDGKDVAKVEPNSDVDAVAQPGSNAQPDAVAQPGGDVQLAFTGDAPPESTGAAESPFDADLHREVAVRALETTAEWVEIDGSYARLTEVSQLPTRPFRLTGLHMCGDPTDADLERIARLGTLKHLQFSDFSIEPERLRILASMREVYFIEIMGHTPPDVVGVIATIPGIDVLFWHTEGRLVAGDLAALSGVRSLRRLHLLGLKDADSLLGELANATPGIEALSLNDCDESPEGLAKLSGLPDLKLLGIDARRFSAEAIARLTQLPNVRQLSVVYSGEPTAVPWDQVLRIRDLDWVQLERIATAEQLHGELKGLSAFPGLRHLLLNAVPVHDSDVDALAVLTQLHELRIYGGEPMLTAAGLERLRKALPNCAVDADVGSGEATPAP